MFRYSVILGAALVSSGCAESLSVETWESSKNTAELVIQSQRGRIELDGIYDRETVYVEASRYGRAAGKEKAEERLGGTSVEFTETEGVATITAESDFIRAGVDLEISTPYLLNLNVDADHSDLFVHNVEGSHTLDVSGLRRSFLIGEVTASAGMNGIDLELWPYEDAAVDLETDGDVLLALPAYGPYEIVIEPGPSTMVVIEDLGFDEIFEDGSWLVARRFPATIRIGIRSWGDRVEIVEAY